MTPIERAEAAKRLLQDEMFKLVMEEIRAGLVENLETSAMGDVDTQHEIALSLQLLRRIRTQLQKHVDEGKKLEHAAKERDFMSRAKQTLRSIAR